MARAASSAASVCAGDAIFLAHDQSTDAALTKSHTVAPTQTHDTRHARATRFVDTHH